MTILETFGLTVVVVLLIAATVGLGVAMTPEQEEDE